MNAPNMKHIVEQVSDEDRGRFQAAHVEGNPRKYDWIKAVAARLHSLDARWGLNGKRGDPNNISMDVVTWKIGPTDRHVQAFDICGACGGGNPSVVWSDITNWDTIGQPGTAIWVQPDVESAPAGPTPPVTGDVWTAAHQALWARMTTRTAQSMAEQLAHSFPGEQWGRKDAGPGRALSNDTIARKMPDGRLYGVRVTPDVKVWGTLDAAQRWFGVTPLNHLGDAPAPVPVPVPVPVEPPTPAPPAPTAPEIEVMAEALRGDIASLRLAVDTLRAEVIAAVKGQSYTIDANAGYLGKVRGTISPKQD